MKQKTKFALDYKEKLKTNISNLLEPLVLMIWMQQKKGNYHISLHKDFFHEIFFEENPDKNTARADFSHTS